MGEVNAAAVFMIAGRAKDFDEEIALGGISSVCQGGYRDMDKGEKMDCRANAEVDFCAANPLLSQSPKISDPVSHRIETTLQVKNSELS